MSVFGRNREKTRPQKELPPVQSFAAMSDWFRTPVGEALLHLEQQYMKPRTARLFGYHMLQLGCSNVRLLLDDCPAALKVNFVPDYQPGQLSPVADNESLPLGTESMDVVLIHHALDFTPDSHRLLREASRVITAGGRLFVVGFNPWSTWGVNRLLRRRGAPPPWNGRFLSVLRLIDWLTLLDFRIEDINHGGFLLPANRSFNAMKRERYERLGQRLFAPAGCFYVIEARKHRIPITPVMSRWPRLRAPVIGGRLTDNGTVVPGSSLPTRYEGTTETDGGSQGTGSHKNRKE